MAGRKTVSTFQNVFTSPRVHRHEIIPMFFSGTPIPARVRRRQTIINVSLSSLKQNKKKTRRKSNARRVRFVNRPSTFNFIFTKSVVPKWSATPRRYRRCYRYCRNVVYPVRVRTTRTDFHRSKSTSKTVFDERDKFSRDVP